MKYRCVKHLTKSLMAYYDHLQLRAKSVMTYVDSLRSLAQSTSWVSACSTLHCQSAAIVLSSTIMFYYTHQSTIPTFLSSIINGRNITKPKYYIYILT